MLKTSCIALAMCFAGSAAAQTAARPDPADPKASAPARAYESAFKDYRRYNDPEPARWREANDEMGRLKGHVGHVPGSVPPRSAPAAQTPPGHTGHGARK
jgi:hypothetical protein